MKIRFRREAEADLRAIIDYYEEIAPEAVPAILSDVVGGDQEVFLLRHAELVSV